MKMRLPRRGRGNVSALLDAACAPARPSELSGEEAAVAAFRAAALSPPPPVSDRPTRSRRITAGTTAWLAAIAATATAAGAAFATVGHGTPDRRSEARQPSTPAVAQTSAPEARRSSDATPGAAGSTSSKGASPGTPDGPSGQPKNATSIAGLCRAYLAWDPSVRAERLRRPAFHRLVQAAGGVDEVADYCEKATAGSGGPARPKPGASKPGGNNGNNGKPGGSPANPAAQTGPPPGKPAGGPGRG